MFFLFGGIIYIFFLALGCAGLVAYNIWNRKNLHELRYREKRVDLPQLYMEKGAMVSREFLGDEKPWEGSRRDSEDTLATTLSIEHLESRRDSMGTLASIMSARSLDSRPSSRQSAVKMSFDEEYSRRNTRFATQPVSSALSRDNEDSRLATPRLSLDLSENDIDHPSSYDITSTQETPVITKKTSEGDGFKNESKGKMRQSQAMLDVTRVPPKHNRYSASIYSQESWE